ELKAIGMPGRWGGPGGLEELLRLLEIIAAHVPKSKNGLPCPAGQMQAVWTQPSSINRQCRGLLVQQLAASRIPDSQERVVINVRAVLVLDVIVALSEIVAAAGYDEAAIS